MPWDTAHYLRFGDERTRAAADLVARIDLWQPESIVDLGCGPGNSTRLLRERWPRARVLGLDSSPEMIAAARAADPDHDWLKADIGAWQPGCTFDLVFANAALQWLPDHPALVGRLFRLVSPGGALAFQIPSDAHSLVRTFIREISEDPAWRERMAGPRAAVTMDAPSVYYDSLAVSAGTLDIWETEYSHVMEGPQAIVDWISSTGLRPFLDVLDPDERSEFVDRLLARVAAGFPRRVDGRVLFPFRRLFVIAYA
jgi:trans-aconitate 2-methyltransferase